MWNMRKAESSFASAARAVWRHKVLSGAAIITLVEAASRFETTRSILTFGNQVMVHLAGEDWLSRFVASPWWRIVCLAAAVLMLWWIGKSSQREQRRAAQAETEARQRGLEIPLAMMRAEAFRQECWRFDAALKAAENLLEHYKSRIDALKSKPAWWVSDTQQNPSAEDVYRQIRETLSDYSDRITVDYSDSALFSRLQ
jgi:hypothetical protein